MRVTNHDEARQLLRLICGDSLATFQTFDDNEKKEKKLSHIAHGLTDENLSILDNLNGRGAGVFFTLNQTNGKGRTAKHIIGEVRTLDIDHDYDPVYRLDDKAHAVTETSPGKYHSYLKVSGIPLEKFTELQEALAAAYNADPSIKDLPRVSRLPGFYHQKGEPFQSRIISIHPDKDPYTIEQIREIIAAGPVKASHPKPAPDQVNNPPKKGQKFTLPETITGNRKDTLMAYIGSLNAAGLNNADVRAAVESANATRCYSPLPQVEIEEILKSGRGYRVEPKTEAPDYVEALNKDFFVSLEGNKTFVFSERYAPELDRNDLVRMGFNSFREFHNHQTVILWNAGGQPVAKKRGSAWLDHPQRRQYNGVMLAPPGLTLPEGYYNLWKGYGVEPIKGDWHLMQHHLLHTICRGSAVEYKYLLGWLATCVQKPAKPAEVAVVLRGKKGTGKGILGHYMRKIFAQNALHISSAKHLVGNFNSHLRSCIFLFADESFWAGDKQHESVLKALITEPTLTIEGKGIDAIEARNMLHILMASNSDWVVPSSGDERRYFVLDVSDEHAQDGNYFTPLIQERDNGGLSAMLYDLLNHDLSGFNIRKVPQTAALLEQKLHSMDPLTAWWFGRLQDAEGWRGFVPVRELFNDYLDRLSQAGQRKSQEIVFGIGLKRLIPNGLKKIRRYPDHWNSWDDKKQINHYEFPPIEECRAHFSGVMGDQIEWDS